jgi:hypothetical protein
MTKELKEQILNLAPADRLKKCFELSPNYKKEEILSLIKELEESKNQDDLNHSLYFAFMIKDQERFSFLKLTLES